MWLEQHEVGPGRNFTYIVADRKGGEGVVIDPSYGIAPVLHSIDAQHLKVHHILNTHSHSDHWAGNAEVRKLTGAKVVAHRSALLGQDLSVGDGDRLDWGPLSIEVRHTPGHTADSVLYIFEGHVATGDTLFVDGCGRVDLPGSDPRAMFTSLLTTVVRLDDALVVLPGHNYGRTPTSTIGREKRENDTLKPRTLEEFLPYIVV
ncbi:MAG: MBL fold metallo-hydrolase [Thermoplasmata archaeon]|nr:MBL fold metallo-hydrolase [Thermoplasmata archaeon]